MDISNTPTIVVEALDPTILADRRILRDYYESELAKIQDPEVQAFLEGRRLLRLKHQADLEGGV